MKNLKTIITLFSVAALSIFTLNGYMHSDTPFYKDFCQAVKGENIPKIQEIISLQTNKQAFINEGLLLAAEAQKHHFITYFLSIGADVNAKDAGHWTALHYAACSGSLESAQLLLTAGADIDALTYWSQVGPIIVATEWNRLEMVKLLTQAGARLDIKSYYLGQTVLHTAINANDAKILAHLIKAGAPLNMRDKSNRTPYMLASEQKNAKLIKIIASAHPEITAEDLKWIETTLKEQEEDHKKYSRKYKETK